MSLSVVIVDDSILIRERLATLISELDGMDLVGQAATVAEAMALTHRHQPDVVVLDIRLPDGNGIQALQAIKRIASSHVIMLTAYAYPQYREKCLQLGADYFLDKVDEFDHIVLILEQMKRELLCT